MPTVFRFDGYRFFFFSNEHTPEHVHVEKGDGYAKVEIKSLKVVENYGFSSKELKKITRLVQSKRDYLLGAWSEYFKES